MPIKVDLSVHGLVDFVLRRGSIDSRSFNNDTMAEGTRIHMRYQSLQDGSYQSEVPLEGDIERDDYLFHLHGRADGIINSKNYDIIDEIKSCNVDLDTFFMEQGEWHLGQAICYAYLLAKSNNYSQVGVKLTYISQVDEDDNEIIKKRRMVKDFLFSYEELEKRVFSLLDNYLDFYQQIENYHEKRNQTAETITFPFSQFRKGQREAAKYVYQISHDGGLFFFEAPTGTGKTMSSIFPAIKTYVGDINEKIFYLTAKTQAKIVAEQAIDLLIKNGLYLHSITLSSKESLCQLDESKCNPEDCPFAKEYYSKVNDLIKLILLKENNITKEKVLTYALSESICPFEFQLDVSLYCDFIICDYNYIFDPLVYLKRFFDEGSTEYFALIDEAHNLSERTKDMYTAAINYSQLDSLSHKLRSVKKPGLKRHLTNLKSYMKMTIVDEHAIFENDFDSHFYQLLENLYQSLQDFLKDDEYDVQEALETFRMINRFLKIHDYLNSDFVCYTENGSDLSYVIRCLNASDLIRYCLSKLRGAVFFSATLSPMEYYVNTLGGDSQTPYLRIDSPFNPNHVLVMVQDNISTRYRDRDLSYSDIASSIKAFISEKTGNYLVFFSSYAYLQNVLKYYKTDEEEILIQERDMDLNKRDFFLSRFIENPDHTVVGFAVLGGSFSEGIDLTSSRLIGAVIVGIGLPMVSFERSLIKDYYDKKGLSGFDYAYTNPGKNKVMQASGRVIRTDDDIGALLFIDERFASRKYSDMFRGQYKNYVLVRDGDQISYFLEQFWRNNS